MTIGLFHQHPYHDIYQVVTISKSLLLVKHPQYRFEERMQVTSHQLYTLLPLPLQMCKAVHKNMLTVELLLLQFGK